MTRQEALMIGKNTVESYIHMMKFWKIGITMGNLYELF